MAEVIIRHRDGRELGVSEADYHRKKIEGDKTYEDMGFKIVANADGSPSEAPAPKAAEKAADAKKGE